MRITKYWIMVLAGLLFFTGQALSGQEDSDLAIQRVTKKVRSDLGELASSNLAKEIAALMKQFDAQYKTWSESCVGATFDPESATGTCKEMAHQMRATGIGLYGKLSEYLPNVQKKYESGAKLAFNVMQGTGFSGSPEDLYNQCLESSRAPSQGKDAITLNSDPDSPFLLQPADFPDLSGDLFDVLGQILPDLPSSLPATVVAASNYVTMRRNAGQASELAKKFAQAKMALEMKNDYEDIILASTKSVAALPSVLGIQYTGTKVTATANKKVLDYIKGKSQPSGPAGPADGKPSPLGGAKKRL